MVESMGFGDSSRFEHYHLSEIKHVVYSEPQLLQIGVKMSTS